MISDLISFCKNPCSRFILRTFILSLHSTSFSLSNIPYPSSFILFLHSTSFSSFNIPHPLSFILFLHSTSFSSSNIPHPSSFILSLHYTSFSSSNIPHPSSFILHPFPSFQFLFHPTFLILHLTTFIPHPLILHHSSSNPSSFILHSTSLFSSLHSFIIRISFSLFSYWTMYPDPSIKICTLILPFEPCTLVLLLNPVPWFSFWNMYPDPPIEICTLILLLNHVLWVSYWTLLCFSGMYFNRVMKEGRLAKNFNYRILEEI